MLRERIGHSTIDQVVAASPQTRVLDVARLMLQRGIGAVLAIDEGVLVGIFTERDAVFRVMAPAVDPAVVALADVMTREVVTIGPDATFGQAMLVMLDHGFRRLPVVENGRVVGLVTAVPALDPGLEELVAEERRRESLRRS